MMIISKEEIFTIESVTHLLHWKISIKPYRLTSTNLKPIIGEEMFAYLFHNTKNRYKAMR